MTAAPHIPEPVVEIVEDTPAPAPTVTFHGRRFEVSDRPVPLLSLMKLATIAKRQRQAGGVPNPADAEESMAILYELVRAMIADDAWPGFEDHANAVGAGEQDFQALIQQAVEARADRPTRPSFASPGGPPRTAPSSAAASSSPGSSVPQGSLDVQHDLEDRGRPDLALVVKRAREASQMS